ncbi:MAG: ATPase [Spirochaetes bacterium]|nr:ATPase [Spirochaetota bacterium]
MEELNSTEILDREILEDARKKAARILKTADDTINAKTSEWEKKTQEAIVELEKKYNGQREEASVNIMARLPVDKLRNKAEKIENILQSSVKAWYEGLSRQRIIEILTDELVKRLTVCAEFADSTKKRVFYNVLDRKEAEQLIKNASGLTSKNWTDYSIEESFSDGLPSITLETDDIRIIASLQKTVDLLLQEKRIELVEALVGNAFMEGA